MSKFKVRTLNQNNNDLLKKANYIEDEGLIRHYCKMRNIDFDEYIKSIASDSDNSDKKTV